MFLLGKIMKGLGSGNIDFRLRQSDFGSDSRRAGIPWLGLRLAEIADLDAALVVGSFLRKDHPLIAQRLRQAAKKYTKVSMLSVAADDQLIDLHESLAVAPSQLARALAAIVKAAAGLKGAAVPAGLDGISPDEASKKIAGSLVDGEKSAIFLGNVVTQSADATQLHALALELGKLTGATVGFLGEAANVVGGHVAGALPSGANASQMFRQPRKAYVLMGIEPELDCGNPQVAVAALKQANLVVCMSAFKQAPALEYADVMLPIAPFTETAGTFVNIEGRVQGFNGVVKARGDSRPAWKVLRVLGNVLNLDGFSYESSESVRDEVLGSGGEFVSGLDNGLKGVSVSLPAAGSQLQRIADVPINFADPLARRAPALQQTADAIAPVARINTRTLAEIGVAADDKVRVKQGQGEAVLVAKADNTVPVGCVRVAAAHASTAALGGMFDPISVERA
jgi:NADH-quinone oxidoreductase subunit G